MDLVKVLWLQHQVSRKVTAAILSLATPAALADAASRRSAAGSPAPVHPHVSAARGREDTVLFPAFPALLPRQEYQALGEKFENREQKLFGKNGFENIVSQIADLEKQLGIYDLSQFTPIVNA